MLRWHQHQQLWWTRTAPHQHQHQLQQRQLQQQRGAKSKVLVDYQVTAQLITAGDNCGGGQTEQGVLRATLLLEWLAPPLSASTAAARHACRRIIPGLRERQQWLGWLRVVSCDVCVL